VDLDNWAPLRWPCGPLEVEREKRRESFTAREAEALRAWTEPGALDLVAGTPVNCLVVTWAEGSAADADQQRALAPLVATARQRGLSVVGWVAENADVRRAAGAARASGLAAIATGSGEAVRTSTSSASASAGSKPASRRTSWATSTPSGPA
jgi:hypothetical protein